MCNLGAKSQLKHAQSQHRGGSYKQTLKVLFSHIPMTDIPTSQGDAIIEKFKPNMIFSGKSWLFLTFANEKL